MGSNTDNSLSLFDEIVQSSLGIPEDDEQADRQMDDDDRDDYQDEE